MSTRRGPVTKGASRYAPYHSARSSAGVAGSTATITTRNNWRDVCMEIMRKQLPDFEPRNDFDIMMLGTTRYSGARAKLETWLDEQLAIHINTRGSYEVVMEQTREALAMPSSTITGLKPLGSECGVFLRPIPHSSYSIRLFPGCLEAREYCLDFINTRTGLPVNSPFKFELWAIPNPSLPWIGGSFERVVAMERMFGFSKDEAPPGEETFLLRDGQTYLLKRPGRKDVRFTVPVRRRPLAAAAAQVDEVDQLDLPESVVVA
ncbi:hypothetical protein L226DRAFT_483785 [Lentinus tigrinus ALCF2SS1-7]|uniref:uncharacterized protein n=1 Tax=Lentinus tigrinus ALCF2SS1-7 TaxID=1328758 RepID=UPI001165F3B0|nr:hypothetical protein L226DRAFT_483785 [Lentinus tigrinus ALCF2SS1-7]